MDFLQWKEVDVFQGELLQCRELQDLLKEGLCEGGIGTDSSKAWVNRGEALTSALNT